MDTFKVRQPPLKSFPVSLQPMDIMDSLAHCFTQNTKEIIEAEKENGYWVSNQQCLPPFDIPSLLLHLHPWSKTFLEEGRLPWPHNFFPGTFHHLEFQGFRASGTLFQGLTPITNTYHFSRADTLPQRWLFLNFTCSKLWSLALSHVLPKLLLVK